MIERRAEYPGLVEALYQHSLAFQRGEVLSHENAEHILGVTREDDNSTYRYLVNKWRNRLLLEQGIATLPVVEVGYELLTTERQVKDYDGIRLGKARRQLVKAVKALRSLPDEQLSPNQRALKHSKIQMLKRAHHKMKQKAELREAFNRPQQRNPIRPVPEQLAEITY